MLLQRNKGVGRGGKERDYIYAWTNFSGGANFTHYFVGVSLVDQGHRQMESPVTGGWWV